MLRQLIFFIVIVIQPQQGMAEVSVRWAVFDFNPIPFQRHDNGRAYGPDIEIIRMIFSDLDGYSLDERIVPVARAALEYPRGGIDFILIFKSPMADGISLYTETPLRWITYTLAVKSDRPLNYKDINSLKGFNIGIVAGTPISGALSKAIDSQVFNVVGLKDYKNLLEMLDRGRIDAIFGSITTLKRTATVMGVHISEVSNSPSFTKGYFPTLSIKSPIKHKEHLLKLINQKLRNAHSDGRIAKIYRNHGVSKQEYWPQGVHLESKISVYSP